MNHVMLVVLCVVGYLCGGMGILAILRHLCPRLWRRFYQSIATYGESDLSCQLEAAVLLLLLWPFVLFIAAAWWIVLMPVMLVMMCIGAKVLGMRIEKDSGEWCITAERQVGESEE